MKLISMTEFVLNGQETADYIKLYDGCFNYAKFLKQPLQLGFFVPCDLNGNVLEEPKPEKYFDVNKKADEFNEEDVKCFNEFSSALNYYEDAKERILFEGFTFSMEGDDYIYFDFVSHKDNDLLSQDSQLIYNKESELFFFDSDYINDYCDCVEQLVYIGLFLTELAKKKFNT